MKSILENIKDEVSKLNWSSNTKKQKAIDLCISIYNLYIFDGGDFYRYKSLSREYFYKIIGKKYTYEIKDKLINGGILEVYKNGTFILGKKSKCYRINNDILCGNYVSTNCPPCVHHLSPNSIKHVSTTCPPNQNGANSDILNNLSNNYIKLLNNSDLSILVSTTLKDSIIKDLRRLTFNSKVYNWIDSFIINNKDIQIDNDIKDEYVDIIFDDDSYSYKLENALKLSKEQNMSLIKYKDKCYIDNVDSFLIRKTNDLKLIYKKSIFEIENNIFRVSRNETNRRLDTNLTNMKSNLLDYLLYEGEELIELDIANAQFAILSFITEELDSEFIELSQTGKLYNTIKKEDMFRIAFDKIKKEQDSTRKMFPKTMKFIDEYKNKYGYKAFSNLLQRTESMIMIDGLLNHLINKGLHVFTIHDALRVKKSQVDIIKNEVELFFKEIGFKCLLRNKNKIEVKNTPETIQINYKGFKVVDIVNPSLEEKKLFIEKINELRKIGLEPSEELLIDMKIFSKETTWYMYYKWRKINPYPLVI